MLIKWYETCIRHFRHTSRCQASGVLLNCYTVAVQCRRCKSRLCRSTLPLPVYESSFLASKADYETSHNCRRRWCPRHVLNISRFLHRRYSSPPRGSHIITSRRSLQHWLITSLPQACPLFDRHISFRFLFCFYPRDAMLARILAKALRLSVSVCHKSKFYLNGWMNRARFLAWKLPFTYCTLR